MILIFDLLRLFAPKLRRFCLPRSCTACAAAPSDKAAKEQNNGDKGPRLRSWSGQAERVCRLLPCSHKFRRSSLLFAQFLAFLRLLFARQAVCGCCALRAPLLRLRAHASVCARRRSGIQMVSSWMKMFLLFSHDDKTVFFFPSDC